MSARPAQVTPPTRASRRGDTADHFRIMADYAPVMIWLADPDGKSVYFNRAWLEFTGRELAAELGSGWTQGIHAQDRERCIGAYAAAFASREPFEILSYELRSPLNGIKSWTHVLENQLRDADPAIRRALAGIMIGVDHQVRLIDDLLDHSPSTETATLVANNGRVTMSG